ncbi:VUT family protein [Rhodococcus hoagii]|uniref:VUT family protein n=1 Tax=Rhodococcus hoagii TaxID=43767 RepID=A0AAE4ZDR5_RHOHA|nr:VUT family protein [Prescottella equi]
MKNQSTLIGSGAAIALLGSVIAANWATTRFGFVPVGFGQQATAGTFFAGFALAARDATQDALGKAGMLATVAVGVLISYIIADPFIALASAAAFAVAELLNFAVYTPLRERSRLGDRRWATAVVSSSIAGAIADTVVFLWIAFGWAAVAPAMVGQLIGKMWATLLYLVAGKAVSTRLTPAQTEPEEAPESRTGADPA